MIINNEVNVKEKKIELENAYKEWVDEIKKEAPEFLSDKYSNPYYSYIPAGWYEKKNRIFIVGEEGFGATKNPNEKFDDIEKIQKGNEELMISNLTKGNRYVNSPFWNRIRKINELTDMAITWGNQDKVHILDEKDCKLSKTERKRLHSIKCNILKEEIRILNPTIIIFFGWYYESMEYDFSSIYDKICEEYKKNTIFAMLHNNMTYIFSNHPGWLGKPKDYEEQVLSMVKKYLV